MRYILIVLFCFFGLSLSAQVQAKQIKGGSAVDTLYVMTTDTTTGSSTRGLGKWRGYEDLLAAYDTDWLRYTTGTLPNNTDTMYHAGIV